MLITNLHVLMKYQTSHHSSTQCLCPEHNAYVINIIRTDSSACSSPPISIPIIPVLSDQTWSDYRGASYHITPLDTRPSRDMLASSAAINVKRRLISGRDGQLIVPNIPSHSSTPLLFQPSTLIGGLWITYCGDLFMCIQK